MFKFFRQLRLGMLKRNQFYKYLLYAIGEIFLVMIGILLALQVNNWNEGRKLQQEENKILRNLNSELQQNKAIIQSCLDDFDKSIKYTDSLRTLFNPELSELPIDKINYWLGSAIGETRTCDIKTDVLESIRSSGDFKVINNDIIKSTISKWSSTLRKVNKEEDNWDREYSDIIAPYTMKRLAWDDIDKIFYPNNPHFKNSPFSVDNRRVLTDFEFSNIVTYHHWRQSRIEYVLKELSTQTDELSNLIVAEISE